MKRGVIMLIGALHALGWVLSAVQGIRLQIGPDGSVSPDAFLFGFLFLSFAGFAGWLTYRVYQLDLVALAIAAVSFGMVAMIGIGLGAILVIAGFGASDPYIGPVGAILLVAGLAHAAAAFAAFKLRLETVTQLPSS